MKVKTTTPASSSTSTTPKTPTEQTQDPADPSTMTFRMPALETLPEFSDGNFPRWFRGLLLRLRAGNDLGGVVIPPPPAVMAEIIESRTTGAAAAFLSSSASLQTKMDKLQITEDDLDTMLDILADRFPSPSMAAEVQEEPAEQNQDTTMAEETSPEEPKTTRQLRDPGERRSPGEQLMALSQTKDMSAEEYYQQALAALHAFNIEDKHYQLPGGNGNDNFSGYGYGLLDSSLGLDPSCYIQRCVILAYLKGLYSEEREAIHQSADMENSTLAEVYEYVQTCSEMFALQSKLQKSKAKFNNGCEQQ